MKKNLWIKTGTVVLFILVLNVSVFSLSKAQTTNQEQGLPTLQQSYQIEAYNGKISSTYISRGDTVYIFATIGNFGDQVVPVVSLNANFTHIEGNSALNELYSVTIDYDHRDLEPGETFTGTLMAEITNPEARYNVTIFFKAEDVYDPDTGPIGAAPALDFNAAEDIEVHVVDYGGASNVVIGIGLTIAGIVVAIVLFILYGWLKEKLQKRKY